MAKLIPTRKEWLQQAGEQFGDYMRRLEKVIYALGNVRADKPFVGRIISFPVADGSALYVVNSEQPFTIEHIPYADAYAIPAAYVRGLELEDIQQQAKFNSMLSGRREKKG